MAKYQRLSKRTSSLYDKIYGSGVLESVANPETEGVQELEEARGGRMNLYQKIYGSKKTNENVAHGMLKENDNDVDWFDEMQRWIKENNVIEEEFFDSSYYDRVDEVYGRAIGAIQEEHNVEFDFSTQAGHGRCSVFSEDDEGHGEYSWDFDDDRTELFDMVKLSTSIQELQSSIESYLLGKIDCIEWDDEYDDEF